MDHVWRCNIRGVRKTRDMHFNFRFLEFCNVAEWPLIAAVAATALGAARGTFPKALAATSNYQRLLASFFHNTKYERDCPQVSRSFSTVPIYFFLAIIIQRMSFQLHMSLSVSEEQLASAQNSHWEVQQLIQKKMNVCTRERF